MKIHLLILTNQLHFNTITFIRKLLKNLICSGTVTCFNETGLSGTFKVKTAYFHC
jgi:hypothetical protein